MMHVEVSVALNFVMTYLYNKLPRRRVDMFGEELERALKRKFEGHWYPDMPFKGSAFRCIRLTGELADPVMEQAAVGSGLDLEEIQEYLPEDLVVWIDPGEVSYRIGEKGQVKVLYSTREEAGLVGLDREVQAASKGFNPEAQCFKPIDSLSSSLSNLSVSPSSPPHTLSPIGTAPFSSVSPPTFMSRQTSTPLMTTAMFAQTKFGSTKLKTQAKRPSRLSPTELGAYLKQRHVLPPPAPFQVAPPRGFRPRDPRQDFLEQQQRLLLAQQYANPAMLSPLANSPLGGSLTDLYGTYQAPMPSMTPSYQDLRQPPAGPRPPMNVQGPPSPEGNKNYLEAVNMGTTYANLQHLLVAN